MTVTSDEEEAMKKQTEQNFTSDLTNKLSDLSETVQSDDSKIETLDKKLQQQQVTAPE